MLATIISSAEGGIRKHFFDLCDLSSHIKNDCNLVIYPENQTDEVFDERRRNNPTWKSLVFEKKLSLRDVTNLFIIVRLFFKFDITTVHAHGAKAGLYSRLAKLLLWRLNVIYSPHGGAFHAENQGHLSFLITGLERGLAKLTSRFVFESEYAKTNFLRYISAKPKKIVCITNRVSLSNYSRCNPDIERELLAQKKLGNSIISVVGRVRRIKGQDILVKALDGIEGKIVVYFVGNLDPSFIKEEKETFSDPRIVLWGDESDVKGFYEYSDLIVCPSRAESFGYVPLEAILGGAKVVASDIPAFRETLTGLPNVFFFNSADSIDLARAVNCALSEVKVVLSEEEASSIVSPTFGPDFDALYGGFLK